MNSRERVITSVSHKEPDRVPFDFGGTYVTGITKIPYKELLEFIGKNSNNIALEHVACQIVVVDEVVQEEFDADVRGVFDDTLPEEEMATADDGKYLYFIDDWGTKWKKPKIGGFYYDMCDYPLKCADLSDLEQMKWPNPVNIERFKKLTNKAKKIYEQGKYYIALGGCGMTPGYLSAIAFAMGFENAFIAIATDSIFTNTFLDKMEALEIKFWENFLPMAGKWLDMVMFTDDFAGQNGLLISKDMFTKYFKNRYKRLFLKIKKLAPHIKIFFHSCGGIYDIIEDLIEIGVDILNPVQISAKGMNIGKIKKEFGNDIVIWGAGIDTQNTLPKGTPNEVKMEVKTNIETLAKNGGFVFSAVHNIQPGVPPENIIAMIDAVKEYGKY